MNITIRHMIFAGPFV
jgi:hypothetical protein